MSSVRFFVSLWVDIFAACESRSSGCKYLEECTEHIFAPLTDRALDDHLMFVCPSNLCPSVVGENVKGRRPSAPLIAERLVRATQSSSAALPAAAVATLPAAAVRARWQAAVDPAQRCSLSRGSLASDSRPWATSTCSQRRRRRATRMQRTARKRAAQAQCS